MNGNRDFRDLFLCLNEAGAKYLVVGAYAERLERVKKTLIFRCVPMSLPTNADERLKRRVVMSRVVNRKEHNDRSFDIEFWQKVGDVGRFAAAWQMIEVQLIRGQSGELPPFQKSVARFIRRSQMRKESETPGDAV